MGAVARPRPLGCDSHPRFLSRFPVSEDVLSPSLTIEISGKKNARIILA